jgi:leucyl-tRNA synthetase
VDRYEPRAVEARWQAFWESRGDHRVDLDAAEPRTYCLTMFSYPSGEKLHVGHWYNYGPADTWARYRRMRGETVFEPMGFDAFGLPAENFAIKNGGHPKDITDANTAYMEKQLRAIGAMYDWRRKVDTSKPEYYRWTQWIFLKLHEAGLAYRKEAPVNWCPSCQTVLANEQAQDGVCERCGTPVTRKNLEQWFFKITAYADRLLDGHTKIDWPEKTITMQRNWIGRSEGAEIDFRSADGPFTFPVFTTRPDTLWGVTYMVLAPEHDLVPKITTSARRAAVDAYVEKARAATEIDRLSTEREKTGVFTGAYAVNPVNDEKIPIWIADYVLATYGTGTVMAVPAHDQRDHEFAKAHELPIRAVIEPPAGVTAPPDAAFADPGVMVRSGPFDGEPSASGAAKVIDYLEARGAGRRKVNYRLRDWLISRQRYWGAPIPMIHCPSCGLVPVPEDALPVELPYDVDLKNAPAGQSPLATSAAFMDVDCPRCRGPAKRDSDTMDTFVDSSWYWFRYLCNDLDDRAWDPAVVDRWCPVTMYIGGAEHACMHLLYARFITMAMHDLGHVGFDEPFARLVHQGSITRDGAKMSKRHGNVVSPDDYIEKYGADTFRMYLMFMGAYSEGGDWSDKAIVGIARFLDRVWSLVLEGWERARVVPRRGPGTPVRHGRPLASSTGHGPDAVGPSEPTRDLQRVLHHTIREVSADTERCEFNTAISRMMELANAIRSHATGPPEAAIDSSFLRESIETLLRLLAPYAPHFAEELWERTGHEGSIFEAGWPAYDPELAEAEAITVVVQVMGKVRAKLEVAADIGEDEMKRLALANDRVKEWTQGKKIERVVVVPKKLVSIVIG